MPEFSCSWLNFLITDILNPLSLRYQYSMSLSLVAGELSFSFCEVIFPLFFIVFDSISFCFHTVYIGSYISTGWQLENFPGGSDCKETAPNVGDLGLIPGLGRSPGEGKSYRFQLSCLENPMDRGAWWVHGITVIRTKQHFPTFNLCIPEGGAIVHFKKNFYWAGSRRVTRAHTRNPQQSGERCGFSIWDFGVPTGLTGDFQNSEVDTLLKAPSIQQEMCSLGPFDILIWLLPLSSLTPVTDIHPSLEIWALLERNGSLQLQALQSSSPSLTTLAFHLLCWRGSCCGVTLGRGCPFLPLICCQPHLCPALMAYHIPPTGKPDLHKISPVDVCPALHSPGFHFPSYSKWVGAGLLTLICSPFRGPAWVLSWFSCVQLWASPWTVALQAPLSTWMLQARILEWVAMPSSRGSSQPRDQPVSLMSPALAGEFFTTSASWEAHGALIYCTETPVQLSMFN